MSDKPKRGDPCPKCGGALVVKDGMFYLTGIGMFSGLFCQPCNACWNDPGDDFLGAAVKRDALRREAGKGEQDLIPPPPRNEKGYPDMRIKNEMVGGELAEWQQV